jgi:hypothetical protein
MSTRVKGQCFWCKAPLDVEVFHPYDADYEGDGTVMYKATPSHDENGHYHMVEFTYAVSRPVLGPFLRRAFDEIYANSADDWEKLFADQPRAAVEGDI